MFLKWLTLMNLCSVLTIKVGQIFHGIYVPQPNNTNASFEFRFSTDCNECLCNAFSSSVTYAVVNCQRDTQWCLFYENLTINYTFEFNVYASAYFLQPSLIFTTTLIQPISSSIPTTARMPIISSSIPTTARTPMISSAHTLPSTSIAPTSQQTTRYMSTETPPSNTWIHIKNMTVARIGHTSTYIPETGNVLITGGENQSSIEIFISLNRSFTRIGNMTKIRAYHTADRLAANVILLAGGDTADLYDPIARIINKTVNMSTPRFWQKSSTVNVTGNMKTLLSGGVPGGWSTNFSSSADLFNSSTNAFTLKNMTTARYYHTSTALPNGNILIGGGQTIGNVVLNSLELFNSSSNSFVTITATMSAQRYYHTATYIPSIQSVFFAGGYISGNLNTYDLFNVTTLTFVRNGTFRYARSTHTATLLQNGRILLAGGYPAMTQMEIFDPLTYTSSVAANLSIGRSYHTATMLDQSGEVLICGGAGATNNLNSCELYQP